MINNKQVELSKILNESLDSFRNTITTMENDVKKANNAQKENFDIWKITGVLKPEKGAEQPVKQPKNILTTNGIETYVDLMKHMLEAPTSKIKKIQYSLH